MSSVEARRFAHDERRGRRRNRTRSRRNVDEEGDRQRTVVGGGPQHPQVRRSRMIVLVATVGLVPFTLSAGTAQVEGEDAWRVKVLNDKTAGTGLPRPGSMFGLRNRWVRGVYCPAENCSHDGHTFRASASGQTGRREALLTCDPIDLRRGHQPPRPQTGCVGHLKRRGHDVEAPQARRAELTARLLLHQRHLCGGPGGSDLHALSSQRVGQAIRRYPWLSRLAADRTADQVVLQGAGDGQVGIDGRITAGMVAAPR